MANKNRRNETNDETTDVVEEERDEYLPEDAKKPVTAEGAVIKAEDAPQKATPSSHHLEARVTALEEDVAKLRAQLRHSL